MRVVVTGGTGYLGRAIVRALISGGHTPVVFARGASRAGLAGVAFDGDVRDRRALVDAARGADAICHTAALVSVWRANPHEFDEVNVGGLEQVLAVTAELRLPRLVYTSSFLALPPAGHTAPLSANDYQRTKAAAAAVARRARDRGAPIVLLYPGVIYGPGVLSEGNLVGRMMSDHIGGRLPGLIGGEHVWSFAWVDDVAAAHVAALEHDSPAASYQLGGDNVPQRRPFEWLRDMRGFALPRRLPYWAASAAGLVEEARARVTGRPPLLTRATVQILRCDWPMAHDDAARDLGYRVTPLADGLARTLPEFDQTNRGRTT